MPPGVNVVKVGDPQGRGGFYNMIFPGGFERGAILLGPLMGARSFQQFGRYRDCWIEHDGDGGVVLHVYTRVGGGNRKDYAAEIEWMRSRPNFITDADDTFDSTYASFWFRIDVSDQDFGPQLMDKLREIAVEPVDTAIKWQKAIEAIKSGGPTG